MHQRTVEAGCDIARVIVHAGKTELPTTGTQGTATDAAVSAQIHGYGPAVFTRGTADSIEKFTRDDAMRV